MNTMKVEIHIPRDMYERLENSCHKMDCRNVEELLHSILERLFPLDVEKMDKEEIRMVEQRLRDLGYM